jgi:hypothetical protein
MKERHIRYERTNAIAALQMCRIGIGQDFHTLSPAQVDALLAHADQSGYRKPKNANGSRGRYFHDMLQRRARMPA